jgi:hypothetical protein
VQRLGSRTEWRQGLLVQSMRVESQSCTRTRPSLVKVCQNQTRSQSMTTNPTVVASLRQLVLSQPRSSYIRRTRLTSATTKTRKESDQKSSTSSACLFRRRVNSEAQTEMAGGPCIYAGAPGGAGNREMLPPPPQGDFCVLVFAI